MPAERKTLAKYGAKIPVARNTGAKQAQPAKPDAPADTAAKTAVRSKKGGDKKR
ncbi:hypothetical protein [Piscinibacter sp.]|uniref:hypothetical protein n=1 Tax=Piscinibacter sp. TaxID=1903157 RepID=UPI002C44E281|nr:hypothetical protein [Albitalea sp.]HUG22903.1 hypothetical protein [Albitalea sp.]